MIFGDKKVIGKSSSAKWIGRIARQSLATALSALLAFQPLLARAQSVTPDAGAPLANQAGVGVAPNGVPLIDIVTPNTRGLSHNKYDRFNVDEPGLILNNYDGGVGKSLLGGVTPGNANLRNSGPAAVILNEVTSGNRSQLLGPTEIFGGRADVIVANPNGITCDGCGFINTPRAMLTTGTPDVGADGNLKSFTVRGGDVAFGKRGGNFAADPGAVDLFDIVSRAVRIDGPVHARDLRLTIGRNKVDYASGDATPLEEKTGTPEFAIDGSALGAMQADRIKVVVTEKGAGVRMRGDMAANIGELSLSASGKISIGNASGAAGVNLKSRSGIEAQKVTSRKKVVARADNGITLQSVAADESIDLGSGTGLLSVAGDTRALGTVALSSSGGIALGNLEAQRAVSARSEAGNIEVRGSAKTQGDLTITAVSGSVFAGSLVSFRNLALRAGLDIGITGELLAQGTISAVGRSIRSNSMISGIDIVASQSAPDGTPVLGTSGGLTLSAGGAVEAGSLVSADGLDIAASSLRLGDARAQGKVSISGDVSANGQILGGGDVAIAGRIIAADTIASGVDFRASSSGSDFILGKTGSLNLRAGTGTVDVRQLSSAGLLFAAASELVSEGLTALGAIDLRGNVSVDGQVLGAGDVAVSGNKIAVDTLVSGVDFARTAKGTRIEVAGRGDILLDAAAGEIRAGMLISAGSLKATAGRIAAADLNSSRDMELVADVAVSGKIAGAGNVRIEGSSITAATIAAGAASIAGQEGELSLVARGGTVKADVLESAGRMVLDTARLDAKSIAGRGDVDIATGAGTGGQVFAGGTLRLSGGSLAIETLIAGLDFARTATSGGKAVLADKGGITVDAAGFLRVATLLSAGDVTATVGTLKASSVTGHGNIGIVGDVDVDGQLFGAGDIEITGNKVSAGAIASGVDFSATERSVSGDIILGIEGVLTLTATAGTVAAGTLLSAGDLDVAASKITATNITGRKDIRLSGELDARQILGRQDITIAGRKIKAGSIASGVDFAITEAGDGEIELSGEGSLTVNAASGIVEAGSVQTAGAFNVVAGAFSGRAVTSLGSVSIEGATSIEGALLGKGDVAVDGGSIQAGAIASGVDFAATSRSASGVVLGDQGTLTLTATAGNVAVGTLLSAGDLRVTGTKVTSTNITGRRSIRLLGELAIGQVLGGQDIAITGPKVKAGSMASGVDFAATQQAANGAVTLSDDGALTITAISGSVDVGTILTAGPLKSVSDAFSSRSVTAYGAVSIEGATDIDGSLLGGGDVTISGGNVQVAAIASGVDFRATKRSASSGVVFGADGALTVTATSGNVKAGTLLSAGDLGVTAQNDVSLQATSRRNLTVKAGGSISVLGQTLAGADVSLRAGAITANTIVSGVDFDATQASPSGALVLKASGSLSLDATAGTITVRQLASGSDLFLHAAHDITYEGLQSLADVNLVTDQGSVSIERATIAKGDISLTLQTLDLSKDRGKLAADGTLIVNAANADLSDSTLIFGGLRLNLTGRADLSSTRLRAVKRGGGTGDISISAGAAHGTADTEVLAERDLTVALDTLDNSGQLAAGRDLTLSITGDLANRPTGILHAGRDADFFVAGDLLNDQGAILAGKDLTIAAAAAGGRNRSLTNVSGFVRAGSDVTILTDSLVNKRAYIPALTEEKLTDEQDVSFRLNPEVAVRPFMHLYDGWNNDYPSDRLFPELPMQYLADYKDDLWSVATLADGSSYRAWTWTSRKGPDKSDPIRNWIAARVPRDKDGNVLLDADNFSKYFIVNHYSHPFDSSTAYTYDESSSVGTRTFEQGFDGTPAPQALIRAGANLSIDATKLSNSSSGIEAEGNATITARTLNNEGVIGTRRTVVECRAQGACEAYDADGNRDPSNDIASGTSVLNRVEAVAFTSGTIKAAGDLVIRADTLNNTSGEGSVAGNATLAAVTTPGDPVAALTGITAGSALFTLNAAFARLNVGAELKTGDDSAVAVSENNPGVLGSGTLIASGQTEAVSFGSSTAGTLSIESQPGTLKETLRINGRALAALAKPDSGGFGRTIPGQIFLFETRAAFLDVGKFYGSGYFASRIGYKPDTQVPFLGDAYFENQLIDSQLRQATGHGLGGGAFAPGSRDAIEEMKLLLDNGADYAREHSLGIGESLSPEQVARLTESIVLYEKRIIQGVEVLAPIVYIAGADKARLTASGALIAGGSVDLNTVNISNSGVVAATASLSVAATNIVAEGGSFIAGGDLTLASTGELTLTAQSLDIGGQAVINPNAAIRAGGNAVLLANDGLKLQGVTAEFAGSALLSANTITLDALKVDNGGSQNATGSSVTAGRDLAIAGKTSVSVIGSAANAGGQLLLSADQGSVNVVSTEVARKTSDGYTTTTEIRQQDAQLVSGGSTIVEAADDILLSGSSIRSGANTDLTAGNDINITAANEQIAVSYGGIRGRSERHSGSVIEADGSINVTAGSGKGDHDINIVGSRLAAGERVDLQAAGDLTIAEARDSPVFDRSSRSGSRKNQSNTVSEIAIGSSVSGDAGLSTVSGGDTLLSASKLEAGSKDRKADLSVSAQGDLVISSGKDTYDMQAKSTSRGFLRKSSLSVDVEDETTVASELGASGNVTLDAGEDIAIAGSKVEAGQSVAIEGDNVAVLGAEEKHFLEVKKKKSGLFAGSGDGFISLWGKEQKESRQSSTENVASKLTAGEDVTVKARDGDVAVVGSAIDAARDIRLEAARDVNVTPGAESSASQEKEKRSGFGIAYSSGNGGASIGIGYGSRTDEVRESAETNAGPQLSAGRDATIAAGRDANLQAAKVEAERDVAIAAARDVNLLSAQDRTNYEEVHEQLFAGVTLSVSTGLVSAAESVGNAASKIGDISDGYSAANAAFASLKAYDALDDIASGNVVSGSLTVGFDYSKEKAAGEASIPVTTDIRAGRSVTIDAVSGDLTGRGTQIAAGYGADGLPIATGDGKADEKAGDITLRAGDDVMLENATAASSASSGTKSASAGIGIGAGIGVNGVGVGLTGNAAAASGKSNGEGTTAVNARVTGRGDVTIRSGDDTVLKGAVVSAEAVTAEVGDDLTIVSVPDTGKSANSSLSGGFSLGGALGSTPSVSGISIGGGKGSGSTNWITEQSGLVSGGSMDVTVGGDTHLGAARIVSETGALTLDTGTLTHENFEGEKQYEGVSATLGLDLTGGKGTSAEPVGNSTLEGGYQLDDTRQTVRATVGSGKIEVRDEEKQAALERDGSSTLPLDELNRDPDQAYEITKDKHVELEVYLSERSLKAAAEGIEVVGKSISQAFEALGGKLVASGDLTASELETAKKVAGAIGDGSLDLKALVTCSGRQGFNLLDLFITPAYAASGCVLFDVDGKEITELTAQEREACVQMLATLLEKYASEYLVGDAGKGEMPGSVKRVASTLRKIGSDEQLVASFQALGMSAGLIRDIVLQQALGEEAYADFQQKFLKPLEAGGELTKEAAERAIEQVAAKYGLSAQDTKDLRLVTGVTTAAITGALGSKVQKGGSAGRF
ncbi:hemagglutinin repeat-containing protein [Sinorhizobium meliloti]|uniref:hemagglutinin repeat-containing protein n=1 Tax=Rhizobium meliloti TaxID=382 RepID=UPI003B967BCF